MREGWEIRNLGEVCSVIAGQSPEGKYYNSDKNGLPFYQGKKKFQSKYIGEPTVWTTKITKEAIADDILMSVRAPVGPINYSTQNICIGRGLAAIRAGENIDKEFLYSFLLKIESELVGNNGAVFNSINKKQIESISIPLPPLPEQQRIVSIIDKAFAAIDKAKANAEQNLKNARELFESYLQGVFENNGERWEKKELSEIVDSRCNLSYGIVQPGNEFPNGIPVIRPVDLKNKYVRTEELKLIDPTKADSYKRTRLIGDELLLCVRGNTGVISLISEDLLGANVTRGIVPICFDPNQACLMYGYYMFLSPYIQKQIKAKTYGAALMQINIRDVRKLKVFIPAHDEQLSIVQKLEALSFETQKLEVIYNRKVEHLKALKKSTLQKAFNGELRSIKEPII